MANRFRLIITQKIGEARQWIDDEGEVPMKTKLLIM